MNLSLYKKQYSTGIYNAYKGKWSELSKIEQETALKKRWYVRWSYRNPASGKMERQENIYRGVNEYKTHRERMHLLKVLERSLVKSLEEGLNPYEAERQVNMTVFEAIDHAMTIKKNRMKHRSYVNFKSDINKFKDFLKRNGFERRSISVIDKKVVTKYLNEVLNVVSARSRNNYKDNISAIWQILKEEEIIQDNFVSTIPKLKSIPQRHRTYNDNQVNEIFGYLEKTDPEMLLYIKFISFNFLRNIEVSRLRVEDIFVKEKTLSVMVKQGYRKTKIIPDILLDELPDLKGKTGFIFGKDGLFEEWDVSESYRRSYYGIKYSKVKKHFNLSSDYTLYSYRHWAITRLFNYYRKELGLSLTQTHDKLMLVTGHTSLSGLRNYLRSIDADKPEDYSEGLV